MNEAGFSTPHFILVLVCILNIPRDGHNTDNVKPVLDLYAN